MRIERQSHPAFGSVEVVYLGERRVGMVYQERTTGVWMAHTDSGEGAESREDAFAEVLAHAHLNPEFEQL